MDLSAINVPKSSKQIMQFALQLRQKGLQSRVPHISLATSSKLGELILQQQPKHILELGAATGYSALLMISYAYEFETDILSFEISQPSSEVARDNVARAGVAHRVKIEWGNALEVLPTLPKNYYDFVFIDAQKKYTVQFLEQVLAMCAHPAIIVIDDAIKFAYKMNGLMEYVQQNCQYEMIHTDQDDGIMVIQVL